MEKFIGEIVEKYNSYCDQQPDEIDQWIKESIKSDPDRDQLLQLVQSGSSVPLNAIFPIADFVERRMHYICSGSFGSALLLQRGRRRTSTVLKVINCVPHRVCYRMANTATRYGDVRREIVCLQTLTKLINGVRIGHRADTGPNASETPIYRAPCFSQLHETYLCERSEALVSFEAHFMLSTGTACYPTLEQAVLVMDHCGTELVKALSEARFVARQLVSVYKQTVLALVVAEKAFHFEHRDLHLGNLMTRCTKHRQVKFSCGSVKYSIASCGMQAMIIDFTYARLTTETGETVFKDLSTLLPANTMYEQGQADQFDGYKDMHRARADRHLGWEHFSASSNLAWIKRFTKEILAHLAANKEHLNKSVDKHKESTRMDLQSRLEVVQLYLGKVLVLACQCGTTEQFLAKLIEQQNHDHQYIVPIKVK